MTSDWCFDRGIRVIGGFKEQSGNVACVAKVLEKNDDVQRVCIKLLCYVASHILWSRRQIKRSLVFDAITSTLGGDSAKYEEY